MSRRSATSADDRTTLAAYLREIAKLPRLTVAQERELGARIQRDKDQPSISRLVESNLRFVVSYARRYRGFGVPLLDLIHEGNLGLIEAARRFDPGRNVKFITYAVWWVRQAMVHALAEQTRAFAVPPKLLYVLGVGVHDVSLDDTRAGLADGPGRRPLADTLTQAHEPAVESAMIHQADVDELSSALKALDRKERDVVRLRYGLHDDNPWTLQAIGNRLHLSRERVRQIEVRAKDKVRRSARLRSHLN